jgi:hypothetical protein
MNKTGKYTKKNNKSNKNTRKKYPSLPKLQGQIIDRKEGWIVLKIYGDAYERGFAHGHLLKNELKQVLHIFPFLVKQNLHVRLNHYVNECNKQIKPTMKRDFAEFYEEIRGISEGAKSAGVTCSVDFLIAWNSYVSMFGYFKKGGSEKCSAFIACGDSTEHGDMIMAHNTHTDFVDGQTANIVLYISPANGSPFVMQTAPGYIASITDFFICSSGIIGCETTITQMNYKPVFGAPYFCRIRKAMQYGKTLDDYVNFMLENNAGDYACSWLLGDINTNEIMLFDLGMEHNIRRTKNGVFYGMNSAIDFKFRSEQTTDKGIYDMSTSTGARNFRLNHLLNEKYYGKINMDIGKRILADHYDVHLNQTRIGTRTICKHLEADHNYYPFGCVDGKVINTAMAKKLEFWGRFGSACGREFLVKPFIKQHPEYKEWSNYLVDFPTTEWTRIQSNNMIDKKLI